MLMRGSSPIRKDIIATLQQKVPQMTALFNQTYGTTIPVPGRYEEYEALKLHHAEGPLISVSVGRASGFNIVDIGGWGETEHRPQYKINIYTHCFTPAEDDGTVPDRARYAALQLRDDLAAIIRAVILDNPALNDVDKYEYMQKSLEEEYSDSQAVPNASGRHVAAVIHSFTLTVDESLDRSGTNHIYSPVEVDPVLLPVVDAEEPEPPIDPEPTPPEGA